MESFRSVQVTRNYVNIGTGELPQLVTQVKIVDNGKDKVLWATFLQAMRSMSVRAHD